MGCPTAQLMQPIHTSSEKSKLFKSRIASHGTPERSYEHSLLPPWLLQCSWPPPCLHVERNFRGTGFFLPEDTFPTSSKKCGQPRSLLFPSFVLASGWWWLGLDISTKSDRKCLDSDAAIVKCHTSRVWHSGNDPLKKETPSLSKLRFQLEGAWHHAQFYRFEQP